MKKMFGILGIIVIGFFMTDSADAQFFPPEFGTNIGFSFPAGDFAAEASAAGGGKRGGYARLGFALGADVTFGLNENRTLNWMNSLIFYSNPTNYVNVFSSLIVEGGELSSDAWIILTPLTGIRWNIPASEQVDFMLFGQVGAMYGQSPEIYIEDQFGQSATQKTAAANSFAYAMGGGILINDLISVTLRFVRGNPEYTIETTGVDQQVTNTTFLQETPIITFVGGVHF
ncbi:MAG: hypothetical protein GF372_09625 [Candidatus Marinimicrobia bacterium]|nr:hypothetical protein [Candidatus Neomarinimicrobiota bacterium]